MIPEVGVNIVRSSRRRSLAIEIKYGEVTVRAPDFISQKVIQDFLFSRQNWINSILNSGKSRSRQLFIEDAKIFVAGNQIPLCFIDSNSGYCNVMDNQVVIGTPSTVKNRSSYGLKKFDEWLQQQSSRILTPKIQQVATKIEVASRLKSIRYRYTKSKWGHCSSTGEIQINPRIMMAPDTIQAYLVAHETAHLRYMNHSKDFWSLVSILDPEYKSHREWLKNHQHETLLLKADIA